jgi:hypothetical protein
VTFQQRNEAEWIRQLSLAEMREESISSGLSATGWFLKQSYPFRYTLGMRFAEVMEELPRLTLRERQLLIRRAIDLDDPPLSASDEALVEGRLSSHHADPDSSVPLDELKAHLRNKQSK